MTFRVGDTIGHKSFPRITGVIQAISGQSAKTTWTSPDSNYTYDVVEEMDNYTHMVFKYDPNQAGDLEE